MSRRHILPLLLSCLVSMPLSANASSLRVPFQAQAPFGEWGDPRQAEGCEEDAALMAVAWATRTTLTARSARQRIIDMSNWEERTFGFYQDTSAADTNMYLINQYLGYRNTSLVSAISVNDIRAELDRAHLIIVPVNGRALGNPYYRQPGPRHHTIVITGYDPRSNTFTYNDPGTRHGANLRISSARLQSSLRDYPSGNNKTDTATRTAMIIVFPQS